MKIGLFFGSFNPVHTGHLIIADYMVSEAGLEELWFVISPQNPFKHSDELVHEQKRLHMLQLAIEDDPRFKVCDIEFDMQRPSYSVATLRELRQRFPEHVFVPVIGGDNLPGFHKWKDHDEILHHHELYVYKRRGYQENRELKNHPKIRFFDVPLLDISATYIRENVKRNKSIRYLVPKKVRELIEKEKLYR